MPFKPIRLGKGMIATVGAAMAMFFCTVVGAQGTQPPPDQVQWTIEKSANGIITSAAGASAAVNLGACAGREPKCTATASSEKDQEVTLTAIPAQGFRFSDWGTDVACAETNPTTAAGESTCTFIPKTAQSVRVDFVPAVRLTVSVTGNGFVTSTPAGIECGIRCNFLFEEDTKVTLEARPHGSERVRWNNASCSGDTCVVTMDIAKTVDVEFVQINDYVELVGKGTILISGSGRTTSCAKKEDDNDDEGESFFRRCELDVGEWLRLGSTITLTAIPDIGYHFQGWNGGTCMGTEPSCTVTLKPHDIIIISATFGDSTGTPFYPLYVNKIGNGGGKITSIPGEINCGRDCQASYPEGTTVTLTAETGPQTHFAWGGACSAFNTPGSHTSNKSVCTITMDQAQSVTAVFTQTPSITIHKNKTVENENDEEGGHITSSPAGILCGTACTAEYENGRTVTLQAHPAVGYRFDGWGRFDQCTGYGPNTCILSVTTAQTVNVTFTKEVCESRAFSPEEARMIDMYIAYYGRPPYAEGLRYWVAERLPAVGGNFNAIIDAFGTSEEYNRRFGGMGNAALVGRLYEYILGRPAEPKGLNDYTNMLNAGRETIDSIAIQILNNVTPGTPDIAALGNRRKVARHLVTRTEEGRSNLTDVDLAAIMKNITDNPASADAACAELSKTITWKQR